VPNRHTLGQPVQAQHKIEFCKLTRQLIGEVTPGIRQQLDDSVNPASDQNDDPGLRNSHNVQIQELLTVSGLAVTESTARLPLPLVPPLP
jgi:hypothetical protein